MRLLNVKTNKKLNSQQGFTLMELIIVIILIAILSAIAAPSLIVWVKQARVREAQTILRGALAETQQEAIRKSKNCAITIPNDIEDPTIEGTCLILGDRTLDKVKISHNGGGVLTSTNLFDFKGRTEANLTNNLVIVISPEEDNDNSYQKCIIVSDGLGLIRTGNYPSNQTTFVDTDCTNN